MDEGRFRASAVKLARQGFSVFKLPPGRKEPPPPAFFDAAVSDPDLVEKIWTDADGWPELANIGVSTSNDVIVIDVDVKAAANGMESLEALLDAGLDDSTFTVKTPSGGLHLYYRAPSHWPIISGNNTGRLGQGIDVKAWHGYVLGPGSELPNGAYTVIRDNAGILTLPEWMLELLKPKKADLADVGEWLVEPDLPENVARAVDFVRTRPVPESHWNNAAFGVATDLRSFGISMATTEEIMSEFWPPRFELTDEEWAEKFVKTIRSAHENPKKPGGYCSATWHFDTVPMPITSVLPKREKQARSKVYSFLEAAARAGEVTTPYLIRDMLDVGALSVMYGPSNSGKTFLALDIAYAVASGRGWHGRKSRAGGVLYIAAEGGQGIFRRTAAMIEKYGNEDVPLCIFPTSIDLFDPGSTDARMLADIVVEQEKRFGVKFMLIVVDTLARAMTGDENSTKDMGVFVRTVDKLREHTDAHVMLIHHSGKDVSKGARGSSSLNAAVDSEIEILDDLITATKQRELTKGPIAAFEVVPVKVGVDDEGVDIISCYVQLHDAPVVSPKEKAPRRSAKSDFTAMISIADAQAFLDRMQAAYDRGEPWNMSNKAPPARRIIGHAMDAFGLNRAKAIALLEKWERHGRIAVARRRVGTVDQTGYVAVDRNFDEGDTGI